MANTASSTTTSSPSSPAPRPLVRLSLAFSTGILFAYFFPFGLIISITCLFIIPLIWLLGIRRYPILASVQAIWTIALLGTFLAGAVRMEIDLQWRRHVEQQIHAWAQSGGQDIRGIVEEVRPLPTGDASIILNAVWLEKWHQERRFPGRMELRSDRGYANALRPGDQVAFQGSIIPLRGPHVPTGMSWRDYRYAQGVYASILLEEESALHVIAPAHWSIARGYSYASLERIRNDLPDVQPLQRYENGRDSAVGLIAAMAFGLRGWTPPELVESLQRSGLAHITSISGLHVTFTLLGIAKLLRAAGMRRRTAGAITLAVSVFYIFLVGLRVPTLRAAMMAWALIGGDFMQRRADSLNSLGLAAMILLLLSPSELLLPSFQLSFAATLCILLFLPPSELLATWPGPLRAAVLGILTSTAVVLGIIPFTLYYFHHIAWGAIPGNLFAVPLAGLLLFLTYAWTLMHWLGVTLLADPLSQAVGWTAASLLAVIDQVAAVESLQWTLPFPGAVPITLYFLGLITLARPFLTLFHIGAFRFLGLHAAFLMLALAASGLFHAPLFPRFEAHFIALGQGDCIFLRAPSGETILVDGGPQPSSNAQRRLTLLEEYLLSKGVSRIHLLALTHPDSDHIGALPQVIRRFPVDQVIESARRDSHAHYADFEAALQERSVPRRFARRGDNIQAGAAQGWVLHPDTETSASDPNEDSLVIHWRYFDYDLLLTGDIGHPTERRLAFRYYDWEVDLLKVAHHGSRFSTSTTFLRATQPMVAITQSGRNPFGHPHPDALQRLHEIGAHVLRNDLDGTVRVLMDRRGMRLYTSRSNRLYLVKD